MRVTIPACIAGEMTAALRKAGTAEIGGILMGEHVGESEFAVREITVQAHGGTFASFVRALQAVLGPLARFFRRRGHDYRRFNYLGEWHSHPSFACEPSGRDEGTMWEIVDDPDVGANFAVLLIVRLDAGDRLTGTVTAFAPGRIRLRGELVWEETRE